eukprot:CAMPEP_0172547754 /NCGR_PEP_ID=MMETSP1067-20121228/17221_1 /TAXON_ID=265564 ORGANISM="Thalassiosira punctigera, Strain Tpunct2005C2" /NCGR_SAMPLE_ID=MMETSP1067 /ASSEMBLY_ACC=CAM_ASM_000444 /LENGTH=56 /DNA_ID=CAMNT_0013334891 /DNA_START=28 /DNA_END=198 /DNA_ORIENTATION=+
MAAVAANIAYRTNSSRSNTITSARTEFYLNLNARSMASNIASVDPRLLREDPPRPK